MWVILAFVSALFLGFYEIFKKVSLQNNAVIPVLFLSIVFSSAMMLPLVLVSKFNPAVLEQTLFFVPEVGIKEHLLFLVKGIIVLSSWLFAYFALKHLPISVASPIKATQPVWVVIGAVLFFGEHLNGYQFAGVGVTLLSFFLFLVAGKKEGISFRTNKWLWFIILATLIGALSGLYDKYLMHKYNSMAVQVYSSFYQTVIMGVIVALMWCPSRKTSTPFQFRWSILFISVFILLADFLYFYSLTLSDSLVSIISTIRRSGVIIPFFYGAIVMGDKNIKLKIIDLVGILVGMVLLYLGSTH